MLWPSQFLIKEKSKRNEPSFLLYMEKILPLKEVFEALESVCRQFATAEFANGRHRVQNEGENRSAVAKGDWLEAIWFQNMVNTV